MSGFKSGVTHNARSVSDKDTALAMLDTIKTNSGLFLDSAKTGFIAPHFCEYEKVLNGLHGSYTGLKQSITSFRAKDSQGVTHRHYMAKCECGKRNIIQERVL